MVNIILICFKRNNKNLKKFDKKLNEEKIDFQKETNDDWYNYRFNNKNIQIISYYIIYFSLSKLIFSSFNFLSNFFKFLLFLLKQINIIFTI